MIVMACAGPAAADPAKIHDNAPVSFALGWTIGGIELGPAPMGDNGLGGELALGLGRWQVFAEGNVGRAHITDADAEGWRTRGGIGARWIARAMHVDAHGGPEMLLEAGLGMDRIDWDTGGAIQRPDVSFGWAMQMRYAGKVQGGIRFGVRVLLATAPDADTVMRIACRGPCPEGGEAGAMDEGFFGYFEGFFGP